MLEIDVAQCPKSGIHYVRKLPNFQLALKNEGNLGSDLEMNCSADFCVGTELPPRSHNYI